MCFVEGKLGAGLNKSDLTWLGNLYDTPVLHELSQVIFHLAQVYEKQHKTWLGCLALYFLPLGIKAKIKVCYKSRGFGGLSRVK